MTRREDLGSWLEGTPGNPEPSGLGLPADGPGSLARVPRRIVALVVDWLASMAVSGLLFPAEGFSPGLYSAAPLMTTLVFGVSTAVLVGLLGSTLGHRLTGMRVVRVRDLPRPMDGGAAGQAGPAVVGPPGLLAGLVRTLLLCLVIPAVVWDGDGRGLHDTAAGTVLVRR